MLLWDMAVGIYVDLYSWLTGELRLLDLLVTLRFCVIPAGETG